MKNLFILSALTIALLALVALFSFANALSYDASTYTLTKNSNSSNITITNLDGSMQNITLSVPNITDNTGRVNLALNQSSILNLDNASSATVTLSISSITVLDDFNLGDHSVTLSAVGTNSLGDTFGANSTITFVKEFCEEGNINASKIRISDIDDVLSEDEWEWKPRDKIEIDVDVENKLDDDEDFVVAFGIYDTQDEEFVELDNDDFLDEDLSIDEDDTETATFSFEVPLDMEHSSSRYIAYVKAFVDGDEELTCNSGKASSFDSSVRSFIKIEREQNDITLDNIVAPDTVVAGETVSVSAIAYNLGREDEKKVKAVISNDKLGIEQETDAVRINTDDSERVEFLFVIPEDTEEGTYVFELKTLFDYDKDDDEYNKDSDDVWTVGIKVLPSKNVTKPVTSITAALASEAKPGQDLIITSVIKNTANTQKTFVIGARGFESWAKLNSISERLFTLNAGESKTITFNLSVNSDASAQESFFIEAISDGKTDTKEVVVNLETEEAGSIPGFTGFSIASLGQGGLIWVIVIINIILIILIIIVAVRMSRR